jgi:hypothetical protein
MARLLIVARNDRFPALNHSLQPRSPATRGTLGQPLTGQPLSFDATAGRWIVPPPGMTPGAGAAAGLRPTPEQTRSFPNSQPLQSPAVPLSAAGHWQEAVVDCVTMVLGLVVFGLVAGFFLVLA